MQSRNKRRDSILKKGGLQSNKARRVSFSSKVNCKFFNKNEAMPSSPLPTRKRTSTSPRRQRDEETEEVEDKENQAPSNIARSRRTSMKSGSANTTAAQAILEDEVLTMPLKGSFHSSLDDDSMGSFYTTPSRSSFGAAGDLTRRFLDESMDLTQVAIADDLSSSSPPRRQHSSPSSPPLSRTIILNESLDLTGIATDAFVFRSSPSSPPDDGKREADETEERQPTPRRLARRRSVQGRQRPSIGGRASISSSSSSLPEDCTLVFDTTMDMTLSSAPDVDLRAMIEHNDNGNEDDDDDRKKDAAAEHTLLLGTTMDLTSVLDHHGRRDEDDLEGQRAGEEDAGRRAHQNNETQFTDDTMDLTMTSTNHRAKRRVSAYSEDEDEEVAAGVGEEETATCDATMDLTAVMEATMDLTSSLPSSPDCLLRAKLRDAILLPEVERKQWGCDTLAELTKPTELHAKELEDQIPSNSRSKLSADLSRAVTKKSVIQAQSVVQLWSNDVEQSFNSALQLHIQHLQAEHEEVAVLIEQHKEAAKERLALVRRHTEEKQDLFDILQGLGLWQLRSYGQCEVSFLFKARAPLRPHVLSLQLAPMQQTDPDLPRAITKAWLAPEGAAGADGRHQQMDSFVLGLVKGTNVQSLLQRLTCMGQLRAVLEEVTFRLGRVELLLADLACVERLSPHVSVERRLVAGDPAVRLVFSLLDRGAKFALDFHGLHFGFPHSELRWTLSAGFGPVDDASISRLVAAHTAAPTHGLLSRLSRALLRL